MCRRLERASDAPQLDRLRCLGGRDKKHVGTAASAVRRSASATGTPAEGGWASWPKRSGRARLSCGRGGCVGSGKRRQVESHGTRSVLATFWERTPVRY